MTAGPVPGHDFVLLSGSAAPGEWAEVAARVGAAYGVVAMGEGGYLVCTAAELAEIARSAPEGTTLGHAALAVGHAPVPAVESADPPPDADRWVVMEDGLLAGVCAVSGAGGARRKGETGGLRGEPGALAPPMPGPAAAFGAGDDGGSRFCASFPEQVRRGDAASLLVWIGGHDDDATAWAPIEVDATRPVEVLVEPGEGFAVEGPDEAVLQPGDVLATLRFRLRAVRDGPGKVRVFAFQGGRSLAVLVLRPRVGAVVGAGARIEAEARALPAAGQAPDVSVLVMERREQGRPVLEMLVHAPDPELGLFHPRFGPVALDLEPLAFFTDFFREIEEAGERGELHPEEAARTLEAKGAWLFETVVPPELRRLLWRLRDRIRSVQVCSDEPWIPWELCRLTGEEDGEILEDDFLCARFEVTRWMAGVPLRPHVTLRNLAFVAPRDSALTAVNAERAYFASLARRGVSVTEVPATAVEVQRALAEGRYDGVHFSGHGTFRDANPDRSALILEGGGRLSPESISGRLRNLGKASPVVFLNACEVGRGGKSLVEMGGFARRFVGAGAAAFVGAYWSVYDAPAGAFAAALYDGLLAGETFGAAALRARLSIRDAGDPTWLAYTVYAAPSAAMAPG